MSAPTQAEILEDFLCNNDIGDEVLVDVLFAHMEEDALEGDASAFDDLHDSLRDLRLRLGV